jgi:hypothetical protein
LLPRLPKDLPILVLKKKDQENNFKYFKVDRERVQKCLQYLCVNNPQFIEHGIQIDNENLAQLPENSTITLNEKAFDDEDVLGYDVGPELSEKRTTMWNWNQQIVMCMLNVTMLNCFKMTLLKIQLTFQKQMLIV